MKKRYFIIILFTIFSSIMAAIFFGVQEDPNKGFFWISISFAFFALSHLYLPDYMRKYKDNDEDEGKGKGED